MYVAESGVWRIRFYLEPYGVGYGFDVANITCSGTWQWFMADDEIPKHVARRLVRKARRMAGLV